MRLIGGQFRGCKLEHPADDRIRPSSDRLRETLFSMLAFPRWREDRADLIRDSVVLDACCGSGALALEALSRGAQQAIFMDNTPQHLSLAKRNAAKCRLAPDQAHFLLADCTRPPPRPATQASARLVFLDPPYGQGIESRAIPALEAAGWLGEDVTLILETAQKDLPALPPDFAFAEQRRIGKSIIHIVTRA